MERFENAEARTLGAFGAPLPQPCPHGPTLRGPVGPGASCVGLSRSGLQTYSGAGNASQRREFHVLGYALK